MTTTMNTVEMGQVGKLVPITGNEDSKGSHGGGIGCCCLGAIALIVGGICFAVGDRSCNTEGLECNDSLRFGGEVTMIVGASLIGASLVCVAAVICCVGGFALATK